MVKGDNKKIMDNNNIARMPTVYIGFDKREELIIMF